MKILVTGSAGFIGHHTAMRLVQDGYQVVGYDSVNEYYELKLKVDRLAQQGFSYEEIGESLSTSSIYPNLRFVKNELENQDALERLFSEEKITHVCHLAAQAGVRYSLEHPRSYISSNVLGTLNILEACRQFHIENLVYASSSSVYGLNKKQPFSEHDGANHPVSLYGATKKSIEMMAHSYSHLYSIPVTGLRFFTVYGPWGRPDMSPMLFARAIQKGEVIKVFNHGEMARDFTYIDDIVEGIVKSILKPAESNRKWDPQSPDPGSSSAPFRIYNIGNGNPVGLMDFIVAMEQAMGKKARLEMYPMQPGDVESTWADTENLTKDFGYQPKVALKEGIESFVKWFKMWEPQF